MSSDEVQPPNHKSPSKQDVPAVPDQSDFPTSISITRRQEWGAAEAECETSYRFLPTVVHFVHTETAEACKDHESCSKELRDLQKKHMGEGLPDINFNFMVGAGGRIYEGRGWKNDIELPKKLREIKGKCLLIAYMGNCTFAMPPWDLMASAFNLLVHGINDKLISPYFDFNHLLFK